MLTLAERLHIARQRADLTVADVAARAQRHRNVVSRWENGRNDPPLWALRLYSEITGATIEWLTAEIGPPPTRRLPSGRSDQLGLFDEPIIDLRDRARSAA